MRGAAFLSGLANAVVVDIGGTTSDLGMLREGYPREASVDAELAGVRTNFRMPDVLSIGLGGGSHVRTAPQLTIGPDSVGHNLTRDALVFGGNILTLTDIAVASGSLKLDSSQNLRGVAGEVVVQASRLAHRMIEGAIDRIKTGPEPVPVVLVGGGAVLITAPLAGTSSVSRPANANVANAVGAAVGQVSGEVDKIVPVGVDDREALRHVRAEAVKKAIAAGAVASTVRVLEVEEVPLTYLPSKAVRVRIKAIGDLGLAP